MAIAAAGAAATALASAGVAQATTYYWDTATSAWTTGANWSNNATSGGTTGTVPTTGDSVVFNQSSVNGAETVSAVPTISLAGITFSNTGTTALITTTTNKTLTLGTGGLTINAGAGAVTFGTTTNNARISFALSGNQTWLNNSSNALVLNANNNIDLGNRTLTVDGTGNFTTGSAVISSTGGGGAIVKNGAGTLTLAGANTFAGGLSINAGTVSIGSSATAGGAGSITLGQTSGTSDATLITTSTFTYANAIIVAAVSSGTLTISSSNATAPTFSGGITLNHDVALLDTTVANSFNVTGGITGTGNITTTNSSSGPMTLSGVTVNNTGNITNNGSGTGSLSITANLGTNVTGVIQNSANSTIAFSTNVARSFTSGITILNGTVTGTGNNTAFGTGNITLGNSAGGSGADAAILSVGAITIANPISVVSGFAGSDTIVSSGQATLNGNIALNHDLTVSTGSTTALTLGGNITGTGNLSIAATSTGATVLSGANINFTGNITNNSGNTGVTTISGNLGANITGVFQNSTTSRLVLSGTNFDANYNYLVQSGTTLEFGQAASLYNGNTTKWSPSKIDVKSGGTLAVAYGGASDFTSTDVDTLLAGLGGSTSSTGLEPGSAFGFDTTNASGTYSTVITDLSGGNVLNLAKLGTNTLTLTGNSSYTGVTTISGGVLALSTIANGGGNSSMGASSSAASNLVLLAGSGIRVAGIASTDRLFSVGGGGTVSINTSSSGGNTLTFTSTGNIGFVDSNSSNTINLGSRDGSVDFSPRIVDNGSGTTNVTISAYNNKFAILRGTTSTYTGITTMGTNAGTTATVYKLANGGSASSIGASTNAASNWVFATSGTLTYAGTGDSTDRNFTLNADVGIAASGGALTLSGSPTNAAARTLTLRGTSVVANTFSGLLANNPSVLSVSKADAGFWVLGNTANSYTGFTSVLGGTLNVTTLADGNSASSIGQSSNAAANLILATGGALQYTGPGSTTDRSFELGNATIDSSGTGALVFTSTDPISPDVAARTGTTAGNKLITGLSSTADLFVGMAVAGSTISAGATIASIDSATQITLTAASNNTVGTPSVSFGYGSRTLTLTGNNTGANSIAGILQNSATVGGTVGTLAVAKTGNGTWVLSGNNTYTGGTSVSAGKLLVNNSSGSGTGTGLVTVASGATLGGNGTIAGPVTVNSGGELRAGSDTATGTIGRLGTGNLTLGGKLYIDADLSGNSTVYPTNSPGGTFTSPGGTTSVKLSDTLVVTGNVTLGGTLIIDLAGSPTGANNGVIVLIDNDGGDAVFGSFAAFVPGNPSAGFAYTLYTTFDTASGAFTGGNDVAIQFSSVPEPTSLTCIGLAAGGLLSRRRRKLSKKMSM